MNNWGLNFILGHVHCNYESTAFNFSGLFCRTVNVLYFSILNPRQIKKVNLKFSYNS